VLSTTAASKKMYVNIKIIRVVEETSATCLNQTMDKTTSCIGNICLI
jgi:hypothetical protein